MLRFYQWLSWKLPKKLCYFVAIRIWANSTAGEFSKVNSTMVTVNESLERWEK